MLFWKELEPFQMEDYISRHVGQICLLHRRVSFTAFIAFILTDFLLTKELLQALFQSCQLRKCQRQSQEGLIRSRDVKAVP
jgi:hypothetical protein